MRIALAVQSARACRGGKERYTLDLARSLAEAGHEVSLLSAEFDPDLPYRLVPIGRTDAGRTRRYRSYVEGIQDHLAEARYDVIHAMQPVPRCHVYHLHSGLAIDETVSGHRKHEAWLARRFTMVGNRINPKRRHQTRVEKQLLRSDRPPIVLCVSDALNRLALRYYPNLTGKIITLHNAVDLHRFGPPDDAHDARAALGLSADQVVALLIAHHWRHKGVRQAIEALALVKGPNLQLLIVGGDDPAPYRELAAARQVQAHVHFAGVALDPLPWYQAADFFVLPTRQDACSLSLLEAIACGLPVISTRCNGACEWLTDGREGFVLENPADIPKLAGAMRQMLCSERRGRMRHSCLELRSRLSWENHLQHILETYDSVRTP